MKITIEQQDIDNAVAWAKKRHETTGAVTGVCRHCVIAQAIGRSFDVNDLFVGTMGAQLNGQNYVFDKEAERIVMLEYSEWATEIVPGTVVTLLPA